MGVISRVIYPTRMRSDSVVERAALDQVYFGRGDGKVMLSWPIFWRRILNIPVRRAPLSRIIQSYLRLYSDTKLKILVNWALE